MGRDRWWVDLAVFMFALDGCILVADMLGWLDICFRFILYD